MPPKVKGQKVLYPEYDARICVGANSLTGEMAKEFLGWQEETDKIKFGKDYLFITPKPNVRKIRCIHNLTNRPVYPSDFNRLKQEILNKRWRFNAEPIIIGRYGSILNGQHCMIALILAIEEWNTCFDYHQLWPEEPTIEKMIVFGVSEDDDVVNTMDTCKVRTLKDVVYRSAYFKSFANDEREKISGICADSIKTIWNRTGCTGFPTHAEYLSLLDRHMKLLESVSHIYKANGKRKLNRYVNLGLAAGFLYLMASSDTDPKDYYGADSHEEANLLWSRWDQACEFWTGLAEGQDWIKPLHEALADILQDKNAGNDERIALLAKAWNLFVDGKELDADSLTLQYDHDSNGFRFLNEHPTVAGIDRGNRHTDEEFIADEDPTPEEIAGASKANGKPEPKQPTFKKGEVLWVHDPKREPWQGKLVSLDGDTHATLKVQNGHQGAGTTRKVPRDICTLEMGA